MLSSALSFILSRGLFSRSSTWLETDKISMQKVQEWFFRLILSILGNQIFFCQQPKKKNETFT